MEFDWVIILTHLLRQLRFFSSRKKERSSCSWIFSFYIIANVKSNFIQTKTKSYESTIFDYLICITCLATGMYGIEIDYTN